MAQIASGMFNYHLSSLSASFQCWGLAQFVSTAFQVGVDDDPLDKSKKILGDLYPTISTYGGFGQEL